LDHFAPLTSIPRHAVPHFFRRSSARVDAKNAELFLQIRSCQTTVDLDIEQSRHPGGYARANTNSVPAGDNIARKTALLGSRYIHQQWITTLSGRCDDPHFARADH